MEKIVPTQLNKISTISSKKRERDGERNKVIIIIKKLTCCAAVKRVSLPSSQFFSRSLSRILFIRSGDFYLKKLKILVKLTAVRSFGRIFFIFFYDADGKK